MSNKKLEDLFDNTTKMQKHPKCKGTYNEWAGDYNCEYQTTLECDECKYGHGRKDPEAKCNQLETL